MKHSTLSQLVIVLIFSFTLHSCQVVNLVISGTTYYDTEITTNDGRLIVGQIGGQRSSNLPSASKTISIKTEEGRQKIKSEQIKYMTLARKGHPEKKQTLVYADWKIPYTKKGELKYVTRKNWLVIKDMGDNLFITACGHTFSLAKDGTLVITYSRNEGIKYCIKRHNDGCPIYIGSSISGKKYMREQWQEYLADDPELCRKIANKDIDSFDFKAIVEQYTPASK